MSIRISVLSIGNLTPKVFSELLKNVAVVYDLAKPREKEKIIRVIFSELAFKGKTLEYKCRKGFIPLQNRFTPAYDPTGWLVELFRCREQIKNIVKELDAYLMQENF